MFLPLVFVSSFLLFSPFSFSADCTAPDWKRLVTRPCSSPASSDHSGGFHKYLVFYFLSGLSLKGSQFFVALFDNPVLLFH